MKTIEEWIESSVLDGDLLVDRCGLFRVRRIEDKILCAYKTEDAFFPFKLFVYSPAIRLWRPSPTELSHFHLPNGVLTSHFYPVDSYWECRKREGDGIETIHLKPGDWPITIYPWGRNLEVVVKEC